MQWQLQLQLQLQWQWQTDAVDLGDFGVWVRRDNDALADRAARHLVVVATEFGARQGEVMQKD